MRFFSGYCRSNARLVGKTVVITGANCGIGKETARDLYKRGARVILACRDLNKAKKAVEDIKETPASSNEDNPKDESGQLGICQLNLSSFNSVRKCAQHLLTTEAVIHILINNAAVFMCPFEKTEDGFESHFQVNYLGHFLLTLLLLPKIQESGPGCRIVNVASMAHRTGGDINFEDINLERSYAPFKAYAQSKLANILFTKELDNALKATGIQNINIYSLHPGVVKTELGRHLDTTIFRGVRSLIRLFYIFVKTPEQGAQTTIYCAIDEKTMNESGLYYEDCQAINPSPKARNPELAKKLWKRTCELLILPSEAGLEELMKAAKDQAAGQ